MKFLDQARISVKSGKGGHGCASFRREKYIEFGGPDGGNGGRGGNVRFESVNNLNTLIDFRYQQHFLAKDGKNGMKTQKSGKSADDLIIKVPTGTVVLAEDKRTVIKDMDRPGMSFQLLKGGHGGLGNINFKTSTNQAPTKFGKGGDAEEMSVWLRLKLIADIGFIGFPNAGKSTLLSVLTKARPKIANYAFTTLNPNLGVCSYKDKELILADLPGLIEGASQGVGLGDRFLSHAERCKKTLHIIDVYEGDVVEKYKTIRKELIDYNNVFGGTSVGDKQEIVVLSKIELVEKSVVAEKIKQMKKITKNQIVPISTLTNQGLDELKKAMFE